MASWFEKRVADTVERMDGFRCECNAIAEPHQNRDCTPMWHAMSWHGATVHAVETIAEANLLYPRQCGACAIREGRVAA